jgi:hypothetical protein
LTFQHPCFISSNIKRIHTAPSCMKTTWQINDLDLRCLLPTPFVSSKKPEIFILRHSFW